MIRSIKKSFSGNQLIDNYKMIEDECESFVENSENIEPQVQDSMINQVFRPTANVFPENPGTQEALKFNVGFVLNPNAVQNPPLADLSVISPIKCSACKTILNPYCSVNDILGQWVCNCCGNVNKNQVRGTKLKERPEYKAKIFDFIAPPSYKTIPNSGPSYLFAIDTSSEAVKYGLTKSAALAVKDMISYIGNSSYITLITFDEIIRIHNINEDTTIDINPSDIKPMSIQHSKLETVRIPLGNILTKISQILPNTTPKGHCLGSVLELAPEVLNGTGGIMAVFCHGRPRNGPHGLPLRPKNERERRSLMLRMQEGSEFYRDISAKLIQNCISLHLFASASSSPVDFGTVAVPCGLTGGRAHFYYPEDLTMMRADVEATLKEPKMWSALVSVTLPAEAKISMFYCNTTKVGQRTVAHSVLLQEDSISASVQIESNIEKVPIQFSVVYTDDIRRRVVRVISAVVPTSPNPEVVAESRNKSISKFLRMKIDACTVLTNPMKKATTQVLRQMMENASPDKLMEIILETRRMSSNAMEAYINRPPPSPPAHPLKDAVPKPMAKPGSSLEGDLLIF